MQIIVGTVHVESACLPYCLSVLAPALALGSPCSYYQLHEKRNIVGSISASALAPSWQFVTRQQAKYFTLVTPINKNY
jgi:hypothetical protein